MEEAIKKLERKRNEWRERAEYHRRQMLVAHMNHDESKQEEHRQLGQLAVDTANELGYAIEILKY